MSRILHIYATSRETQTGKRMFTHYNRAGIREERVDEVIMTNGDLHFWRIADHHSLRGMEVDAVLVDEHATRRFSMPDLADFDELVKTRVRPRRYEVKP